MVELKYQGPSPTANASGCFDLHLGCTMFIVKAGHTCLIPTGTRVALPESYVGQVFGRRSLSTKGIVVHVNSIDDGDIGVVVTNTGDKDFLFREGDRVAQLMIQKVEQVAFS